MSHDDRRLSAVKLLQVVDDEPLVAGIQGVGGLVEEQESRILVHRTGYQDALPLSLADALPVGPDDRVVLQGQAFGHLGDVGSPRGLLHAGIVYVVVVQGDVAGDGLGEDIAVLHHHSA